MKYCEVIYIHWFMVWGIKQKNVDMLFSGSPAVVSIYTYSQKILGEFYTIIMVLYYRSTKIVIPQLLYHE